MRAGKIRAYAVAAKKRLASTPDIPTVDEAGVTGASGADSRDPAEIAISAKSSRPGGRTSLFVESCRLYRSRHSGPASSRCDLTLSLEHLPAPRAGKIPASAANAPGSYTQPISFIGLPVVAVPVPLQPLPIGVQIIAAPWREDVALRIAYALEQAGIAAVSRPALKDDAGMLDARAPCESLGATMGSSAFVPRGSPRQGSAALTHSPGSSVNSS